MNTKQNELKSIRVGGGDYIYRNYRITRVGSTWYYMIGWTKTLKDAMFMIDRYYEKKELD